ncbi:hypothetical protein [Pseudomonas sp. 34 E 7]|nr:hypothetical protein [Pseudomonas sp. 34 E 7]
MTMPKCTMLAYVVDLCGRGLAPDGGLWADQDVGSDRVHIRFCGNGCLGFRPDGGSLLKSAKVSKTLLPHHSAPRLGSVCPLSGQRGLTGRLRSRSKADQDQERLASHRGYGWALRSCVDTYPPIAVTHRHRGQVESSHRPSHIWIWASANIRLNVFCPTKMPFKPDRLRDLA